MQDQRLLNCPLHRRQLLQVSCQDLRPSCRFDVIQLIEPTNTIQPPLKTPGSVLPVRLLLGCYLLTFFLGAAGTAAEC